MKKAIFNEYRSSDIKSVIAEYVHKEEYRQILIDLLVNGKTYQAIADEYYVSEVSVAKIFNKYGNILLEHIKEVS